MWFNTRPPKELTSSDFDGKDKVSEAEVKSYIVSNITGFTKENTSVSYAGLVYCGDDMGERRIMNCQLQSGRKGSAYGF